MAHSRGDGPWRRWRMATHLFKPVYELKGDKVARGGKWAKELEKRAEEAAERSFKTFFPAPTPQLSFRTIQTYISVVNARCISHFQRRMRFLCRPEGNTSDLFPLEAGEVKAGTQEPLGTVKVQPQYISRMWEQFVCVWHWKVTAGAQWFISLGEFSKFLYLSIFFPSVVKEPGCGRSCSFSVPIWGWWMRTIFTQLYQVGTKCECMYARVCVGRGVNTNKQHFFSKVRNSGSTNRADTFNHWGFPLSQFIR